MYASTNASVSICHSHQEAEAAIRTLKRFGFDVKKLSLIGRGCHNEEHPVGFYSSGDTVRAWGGTGAFWGGMWSILIAPAVFLLPPLGMVAMAGPVVSVVIDALEGPVRLNSQSAVGTALSEMGIPEDEVGMYESALKADKYMLLVHGSDDEVARARSIVLGTHPMEEEETLLNES